MGIKHRADSGFRKLKLPKEVIDKIYNTNADYFFNVREFYPTRVLSFLKDGNREI